jgi:CheY-like chemotaxis protein
MAILSSLELLGKRIGDDPLSRRLLDNAMEGADRGATLTQRMLAFARRQDLKVDQVDLPQLLQGMGDLVQRSIGPGWPISTNLPFNLPKVRVDANQIEMAVLNLIVNARDAMPEGGAIVIAAARRTIGQGEIAALEPGVYVGLSVTDRGSGMDEETLRRATEPFFTTKGVGKGTGLGLPMVHGMTQQIGGTLELESRVGEGTVATLWLPVAAEEATERAPVAVEPAPRVARLRVLAVDDDPLVLINTAALLEDLGHQAIEAESAAIALDIMRAGDEIDMIITDQAMPDMTGAELVAAVSALRPNIPVIIASGYGEGVQVAGREVVRLAKPFNQTHLARAIAAAVGEGGSGGDQRSS